MAYFIFHFTGNVLKDEKEDSESGNRKNDDDFQYPHALEEQEMAYAADGSDFTSVQGDEILPNRNSMFHENVTSINHSGQPQEVYIYILKYLRFSPNAFNFGSPADCVNIYKFLI